MIQKIDLNDIEQLNQIVQLQKKSYLIEAKLINFYDIPNLTESIETLKKSHEVFYGYFINFKIVGIISYVIKDHILDINRLAIDPDYFRQKISSKLLSFVESIDATIKEIIVQTGKDNFPAIALYKKNGFVKGQDIVIDKRLVITKLIKFL